MVSSKDGFANQLITWYFAHKRDLPWRQTKDPYKVWLSEIILQQTRVEQGMPYYFAFIEAFPTVFDLAQADRQTVLKLWQGLGYYSRARNLHETAGTIVEQHGGVFPNTYKGLLALKGVGDYTASAIGSICFDLPTAVVDGNVYRALSRIFGIETAIDSSAGQKQFKALAQQLIDPTQPGTFNQAMMEFGARQCTPRNPDCASCIFKDRCVALNEVRIAELPYKQGKVKVVKTYLNYIVVQTQDGKTRLQQRTQKGIWQQLYEFPKLESQQPLSRDKIEQSELFNNLAKPHDQVHLSLFNEQPIIHKLSHKHLYVSFWIMSLPALHGEAIAAAQIRDYPVPVVLERFIESFGF